MLCLKSVCAKWWLEYARSCPHLMQYLNNPSKWMCPSQTQRCILKKRQFVCVIVSFHAASGLNTWHKMFLCFTALQGESLELENVLSDFIMCCLFYWCVLFVKVVGLWILRPQPLEPELSYGKDGGINYSLDVWWLKKGKPDWMFGFQMSAKIERNSSKIGWNHFYPNSDVPLSNLLKPPLSKTL